MEYVIRERREERDLRKNKVFNWRDVGGPFPSKDEAMKALGEMPDNWPRVQGRVIVERDHGTSREVASEYYGYGRPQGQMRA